MKTVDVLIPTYKPTAKLVHIVDMLRKQSYKVNRIIIINTVKEYYDSFFKGRDLADIYDNVTVSHIEAKEFDHGRTRASLVSMSDADYFVCMTDDAIPVDDKLIENLISPLEAGKASIAYARQCTRKTASIIERYTRHFNYPAKSCIKTKADIEKLGIKAYFCSDVCAAYDRKVYDELGGFINRTIFNEDMIIASRCINAGYSICYAADAKVLHYHKYTNMQQLRRNFDLGVSHADNPDVFDSVPPQSEGVKLVKDTANFLIKKHKAYMIPSLIINSGFKFIGYKLGRNYRKLPRKWVLKLSMNSNYWKGET